MCDPASAALALSAVGTAVGAAGAYQQGQAASASAAYQAAVMRNNQILAERAAQDAIDRGKVAEQRQRQQTKALIGRQRAILAANGVLIDQDSALDITTDTAGIGELDALTIRSNAEREALGFRSQGMNFAAEAGLADARGSAARSAGLTDAFGTALSGAGAVADKWYNFKRQGAWSTPASSSFHYSGGGFGF